jgi:2-oxoglutarate ferredoxin oxidoreductase subunit beta
LKRAHANHGASFVEIFQNCIVFNDGAFDDFTEKKVAAETQLHVAHGKPLLFGPDSTRGLRLKHGALELEVVTVGDNGVSESDVLVHDERNRALAALLAGLEPPEFPMVLGVLYCDPAPSYDRAVHEQVAAVQAQHQNGNLNALLRAGRTWMVE